MTSRNRTPIYNGISVVFVVLSALTSILFLTKLLGPAEQGPIIPTLTRFVPPTSTSTFTPTVTNTPTRTPYPSFTPTNTDTPTITFTPTIAPTIAPTSTITDTPGPTLTPSITPTASISPTLTPTLTPTGPTPTFTPTTSWYMFTLREAVLFSSNSMNAANSAGCAWQGMGGAVYGLDGQEVTTTYQIHVIGDGVDRIERTGTNSFYGQRSGWEIVFDTRPSAQTYTIWIETTLGVPLSDEFVATYSGDCEHNLATVYFVQIR